MTLGMAASISTREMIGCRIQIGASSVRKIAVAMLSGDGDQQREEGGDQRPEDEGERAVLVIHRIPFRAGEEAEAELPDRPGGAGGKLPAD